MRAQLIAGVRAVVVFTVLLGVAYPLAVTAVAQIGMGDAADGSLIRRDGKVLGSRLMGQSFDGDQWFQPRPSSAGEGYDAMASSASNLGPTNPEFLATITDRVDVYRSGNGLDAATPVPVDAVTGSGSGLDPDSSVANARLQAPRVAQARGIEVSRILALVDDHTEGKLLGFVGEPRVNVVELNIAVSELG